MKKNVQTTMIPMPIAQFISGMPTPVDLFIRLSEDKFVLIVKKDTTPEKQQLTTYKDRNVDYLWIKKEEYPLLGKQNITIAGIAISSNKLTQQKKSSILNSAAVNVFGHLDYIGINTLVYEQAKNVSMATVALAEQHLDLALLFQSLNTVSNDLVRHSMAVSTIAVLIAQEMNWKNPMTMEKLALGGLLHDIGKKSLPKQVLETPLSEMTRDELLDYETHTFRGMEILNSLGCVPDDIVSIVYEHHENSIGQGYPRRLRDPKTHPLAKVVALANQFAELTFKSINNPIPKTAREAIVYIEFTMGQPFNQEAFSALKKIVTRPNEKTA